MIKVYEFSISPNEEQKTQIEKAIKYSRFVYNSLVKIRYDSWINDRKNLNFEQEREILKKLIKKNGWLRNVEKISLEQAIRDLDGDYYKFFKMNGKYPKFRSPKDEVSKYRTKNVNNSIKFYKGYVALPGLDLVKLDTQDKIRGVPNIARIEKKNNKYKLYISVETH